MKPLWSGAVLQPPSTEEAAVVMDYFRRSACSYIRRCAVGRWSLMLALPAAFSIFTLPAAAQTADSSITDVELMQRADSARMFGTDTTRATIHEFIDFACSTCRAFYLERSDSLRTMYVENGEVNLVVHTFVIPRLMRGYHAAEAAFCAGALAGRDGFEGMQRRLFTDQEDWRAMRDPVPGFVAYAEELGLPIEPFRDCLVRDAMAPLIMADMRTAGLARIPGTPTFIFLGPGQTSTEHQFYGNEPMVMFDQFLARVR
ncbi:MAG: thioredoxin domain-containing protein [Gemmatimonadales bacterium]